MAGEGVRFFRQPVRGQAEDAGAVGLSDESVISARLRGAGEPGTAGQRGGTEMAEAAAVQGRHGALLSQSIARARRRTLFSGFDLAGGERCGQAGSQHNGDEDESDKEIVHRGLSLLRAAKESCSGFVVELFTGAHGDEAGGEDHGEEGGGDHEFVHWNVLFSCLCLNFSAETRIARSSNVRYRPLVESVITKV